MELINHTPYHVQMFKTRLEEEKYALSMSSKVTYNIDDIGNATIDKNQNFKLSRKPWISEYGLMESDDVFKRGGVDILVFGSAKSPNGKPLTNMNVEVKFNGNTINKLAIFGDRIWKKSILGLEISDPKLFTEMPVTLENAYGGVAEWDGLIIPHGNNPYGKGYHYSKEDFEGKPLPNIENPKDLIKKYTNQPDPVGLATLPQLCELHIRDSITINKEGKIININSKFYNTAFPKMIVEKIDENDEIEILGMSLQPFRFNIPSQQLNMKVSLGEKEKVWKMYIEQVGIFIDKKQIFITYRYPINYKMVPLEIRKCEIFNP